MAHFVPVSMAVFEDNDEDIIDHWVEGYINLDNVTFAEPDGPCSWLLAMADGACVTVMELPTAIAICSVTQ